MESRSESDGESDYTPRFVLGSDRSLNSHRRYPWGLVEVDNPKHSDTTALRSALFSSHLTDLKEVSPISTLSSTRPARHTMTLD